ncbi:hypothetical protein [Bacillus sp. EB600]|uniref:hypothetical protein n=1 Tax=Bacillus sp. EB600 TaxID=2806345 RepID=UPI00210D7953|nr:hypothetical protein [Bacillus sp. EB600]MCQ6280448.1 hypothetical protein [Bacillus sp. EB600]
MFNKQKINKPSSIILLIVLFLGVFISGVDFANFAYGSGFSFMFLLGLILIILGVYFLNKNKVFLVNKKSIINLIVFLFTFGSAFYIVRDIFSIFSIASTPLFAVQMLFSFLIKGYGWKSNLAKLIFIGGLIYLIRANRKPEEKVLLEEEVQQEEEENPVAQGKNQLSVGQWFWTIFLLGIPLVNLILLLVWGFGAPNPRKNFSLATLIYVLIGIIIAILVSVVAGISGGTNY